MSTALYWYRPSIPCHAALIPGTDEVARGNATNTTRAAWETACDARGLRFPNPLATFHDCACKAAPESIRALCCSYVTEDAPDAIKKARMLNIGDVMDYFDGISAWWTGAVVEQSEADRRASICALCKFCQPAAPGGCAACTKEASLVANLIQGVVGERKTSPELKCCEISSSVLAVEVWADPARAVRGAPEWCWMR